jgi:[acyl-carrier-protein] S-malonyltransferase
VSGSDIALVLPGQGSQAIGMGRDLADRFEVARRTFEEADEVLGFSISKLCWEGPETELVRTRYAQPAILVHSVAVWRLVHERFPEVRIAAGHSLGEFSAYVAAGAIQFADAVRLVRRRGQLMYEAGRKRAGSMAAVLGLQDEALERVCAEVTADGQGVAVPANYNSPGQVVISGDVDAVKRAGEAARSAGARRVLPLSVSGAFHSPLMREAEDGLAEALDAITFESPRFPIVSNVTASPVRHADEARRLLVEQLTAPVRWTTSVQAMAALGASRFYEIGPGHVLSNLVRRIHSGAETHALGTADQVEALLNEEASTWN